MNTSATIHEPDDPASTLGQDMPSLIEAPKRPISVKAIVMLITVLAIVVTLAAVGVTRFFRARLPEVHRSETDQLTAATAKAPGSARLFGDAPPPRPEAGRAAPGPLALAELPSERFPPADGGPSEDIKPIPLKADGSVDRAPRKSASGRAVPSDSDGQVLVTQPGRGGAGVMRVSGPAREPASAGSPSTATDEEGAAAASSSNANLDATSRALASYQQQLARTMENLTNRLPAGGTALAPTNAPIGPTTASDPNGAGNARNGLFGGALQSSQTARATAGFIGNRSLTLPKGTTFTCALKTRVISAASGFVACQVLRNVYSDDGRTVLIERGSQLDGEYRVTAVRPGVTRIPTIWTRARTPNGVVIDLESPATGALGEAGLGGYVDNRWGERIGAALLVGFLDDAARLAIANANHDNGDTVVLSSTGEQAQRLPEKILDSTINLPPLIYQNQGGLVGIYLARDIDFSSVYELRSTP